MEVQSSENAAVLKLLKTKSRTKTELLKVNSARRRARQAALDALLAEGKVIRTDKEYFANDPSGSVEQLIHAEAVRLDAYLWRTENIIARTDNIRVFETGLGENNGPLRTTLRENKTTLIENRSITSELDELMRIAKAEKPDDLSTD
jgi:hypothetical protein